METPTPGLPWSDMSLEDECESAETEWQAAGSGEAFHAQPPPTLDEFLEGQQEPLPMSPPSVAARPDDWDSSSPTLPYTQTRVVAGTHVNCRFVYTYLPMNAPLPKICEYGRKRKRVVGLPLLEAGHRRPKIDETVADYLLRERPSDPRHKIQSDWGGVPFSPSKNVFVSDDQNLVMIDYTREVLCVHCDKVLIPLQRRRANVVDKFSFRPCCYDSPQFKVIRSMTESGPVNIVRMVYDLETTPTPEGVHQLYMGMVLMPQLVVDLGLLEDRMQRISTGKDFTRLLHVVIRVLRESNDPVVHNNRNILQLVSFNGSRYDDTFLQRAYREYVYDTYGGFPALEAIEYSERKGAMTFNTLIVAAGQGRDRIGGIEVQWTDVARFVPPTSLRALAKSFKLSEEKGSMPFKVLNDWVAQGTVDRSLEDGFFALHYYGGDEAERARSLEYYRSVVPVDRRSEQAKDVDVLCDAYCAQDVRVTAKAMEFLEDMYRTYLSSQAFAARFEPGLMHSLATMSGRIMLASANNAVCWGWDSMAKEPFEMAPGGDDQLYAPIGEIYDYIAGAIAGGWVKNYVQGLLIDDEAAAPAPTLLRDLEELEDKMKERHKHNAAPVAHNLPQQMTDIASMYPVAVTFPMPLGEGAWVELEADRWRIYNDMLHAQDPLTIPLFFMRGKWKAPREPVLWESTLPQRKEHSNALRWTYTNDLTGTRVYTSLDVWVATRTDYGDSSAWECLEIVDMLYFTRGAQIFRPFMEACAKLKMDGAASKNELMRTAGKIAMNAGVGKLGQRVGNRINALGPEAATAVILEGGDNVRFVGKAKVELDTNDDGYVEREEFVFSNRDATKNRAPVQCAAFMYSATRLMRYNWSLLTRPPAKGVIKTEGIPDTLYGDTDSKLLPADAIHPEWMIGTQVGQFQPEREASLRTRPFFQVEHENVSSGDVKVVASGILAPKKYFVYGLDQKTGLGHLKFKCNGLTRWNPSKPCLLHQIFQCDICLKCPHGTVMFDCFQCCIRLLTLEEPEGDDGSVRGAAGGREYIYNPKAVLSLCLLDFLRTLLTGDSTVLVVEQFARNLALGTSKLPPFTIQSRLTSRSLNRPQVLTSVDQQDRPARLGPYLSGCVRLDPSSVTIVPYGDYLRK